MYSTEFAIHPHFKGTYLVKKSEQKDNGYEAFAMEKKLRGKVNFYEDCDEFPEIRLTCVCPDKYDSKFESYMKQRGILFKKFKKNELFGAEHITKRVVKDPFYDDGTLRTVRVDKFDKLWRKTDPFYLDTKEAEAESRIMGRRLDEYLRTGQKIYAPNVLLKKKGKGIEIGIVDGRHRLASLKAKVSSLPVNFLDEESVKLAQRHGIIE